MSFLIRSRRSYLTCTCVLLLILLSSTQVHSFFLQRLHSKTTSSHHLTRGNEEAQHIVIAVTREKGKNDSLSRALIEELGNGIQIHELPCIEHADGPDLPSLADHLNEKEWDYVIVTSPEAARVLSSCWDPSLSHLPKVAAVGKATQESLEKCGITVAFTPSKALAKNLVKEIDVRKGTNILYPASARAAQTLQDGLTERGAKVVRLNTYDTVAASWSEEERILARKCQIACFASPSAVKGWLHNMAPETSNHIMCACIGETSADACRAHGWKDSQIFFAEKPGLEGWVSAVKDSVFSSTGKDK